MLTKDKLVVRSRDQTTTLPLTSLDFSSLQTTWEKNSSYQLAFTVFDDDSPSFELLSVENSVFWDGQEYVIKQATDSYSNGVHSIQVTATHVFYQLNNRRQNDVQKGDVSFTLQTALDFLTAPVSNYSFKIVGDLSSTQTLTDFGNCSISDGLSTLASAFGVYAIVPDNYTVNLYSEASWTNDVHKAFFYQNNSSEVQLQYDSSTVVNRIQVVSTHDGGSLFDSFYVTDDDSISKWGIRDGERVENDQDNNTAPNIATANKKMVPVPDLSLTVTTQTNGVNMGDVWSLVIPESGIKTKVQVVSITDTPFLPNNMQVTLNNNRQNFLDSFNASNNRLLELQNKAINKESSNSSINMWVVGRVSDNG